MIFLLKLSFIYIFFNLFCYHCRVHTPSDQCISNWMVVQYYFYWIRIFEKSILFEIAPTKYKF